jgi:NMD protein affecting ribosome stability and mRNA decay
MGSPVQIPEEEMGYYEAHGLTEEAMSRLTEVVCTSCHRCIQPQTALRHPELGVTVCRRCRKKYHQGEWTRYLSSTIRFTRLFSCVCAGKCDENRA